MRIRILATVLMTGLIGATSLAAEPTSTSKPALTKAEKLFQDGRDALYRGDYKAAVDLLQRAVNEDKAKISYQLHLARAQQFNGNATEAEKLLRGILKASPDHVEAGQLLGEILAKQENWKEVIALLEPLLKYRHDYPTYHMLAEAKYNLGDYDAARKYFEEAIKLNPQSSADHYQLGNIYLARNFFALAAESYQRALALGLNSPVLHYKLGSAYFNLRNYFGSISVATVKAGAAGTINGDWYLIEPVPGKKDVFRVAPASSAIYQVAKAMADGIEDRPDIHFLRANIYLNAGRFQQAKEMYAKIEKIIPKADQALFYYYYAQSAFGTGAYEEYLSLLGKAIELDKTTYQPTLVDAYLKVAEQYNQAGQLDKYIQYLISAVAESPQTASLHYKLGNAYEEAGKYDQAIVQWKMVLDLEPDHANRLELVNLMDKYRNRPPTSRPATGT